MPQVPQDLLAHRCINYRLRYCNATDAWEFAKDGHEVQVRVHGGLVLNTPYAMVDAALLGHGVAFIAEDIALPHITSGRLVQVLDDWSPDFDGYYLYYPSRRQHTAAFRVVLNALRLKVGPLAIPESPDSSLPHFYPD